MHSNRLASFSLALIMGGLAACGGGSVSGPGPAAATPAEAIDAEEKVLHVYNWPDYIAENTIAKFETQTGIKVHYTLYSNADVLEERLRAHPDAYDVIFPTAQPHAQRMISAGLLSKLDAGRLGNLAHIDKDILRELQDIDPGNQHVAPYMWGTTGLGVNVEKARAALGPAAALDSWGLLFDPANVSKLSSCGIGIMDNEIEALPAALIWRGLNPNDFSPEAIAAAEQAYLRIRSHVRKFGNDSELIDGLADGSLCLVLAYSGDVQQAQVQAGEAALAAKTPAPEIRYVIPREGAMRWMDVVAIPKQAKHVGNAHRFLQYLMQPETIADISNHVAYANANTGADEFLDEAIAKNPGIYPPAEVRAKLHSARQPTAAEDARRKAAWQKILYGAI